MSLMGRLLCSVKQLSFVYILYVVVCEYDAQEARTCFPFELELEAVVSYLRGC